MLSLLTATKRFQQTIKFQNQLSKLTVYKVRNKIQFNILIYKIEIGIFSQIKISLKNKKNIYNKYANN